MNETLKQLSAKILQALQADASLNTAWLVKLRLRASSSQLYLALGMLAAEGKIDINQQGMDYKITLK